MKTNFFLAASLAFAGAACAQPITIETSAVAPAADADSGGLLKDLVVMRALKPEVYVAPAMSAAMQIAVVSKGRVRVAVMADPEGMPADWLILSYSHKDLADSTLNVLRKWRFKPANIEGVPVAAQTEFDIEFRGSDVVTISPVMDQLEYLYRNMGIERIEYRPCPLRELDRIPLLLNAVTPHYSLVARDQGVRGSVEVQFYIDESGTVRLPAVLNADRVDLAKSALEAVRQWKFEPPTRNGHPVLISAIQQFDFGKDTTAVTKIN